MKIKDVEVNFEKGIPVSRSKKLSVFGPVLRKMEVGDSFALPRKLYHALRSGINAENERARKSNEPGHWIARSVVENGMDVCRCWRDA